MENRPVPLAILISGRGSNLAALLAAEREGRLGAQVRVVISNRAEAAGLALAQAAGKPAVVLPHRGYASRDDYDRALVDALRPYGVQLICLAGFMRVLGPYFCDTFAGRVLNIHPSLLPAFPGADAQRQALEHGVRITGATVHFVTAELDAGPIVAQAAIDVRDTDTVASLSARLLDVEHRLYPRAVAHIARGGWRVDGRRVLPSLQLE